MKKLIIMTMVLAVMQSCVFAMAAKGNKDILTEEYSLNKDGFICDWLICGPFPNPGEWPNLANWDTDFLAADGGEAKIRPTSKMNYRSKLPALSGKELTVTWRPVRILTAYRDYFYSINLNAVFGKTTGTGEPDNVIAYAFCYIESPTDMNAKLKVGSDDGFKAWLNGQLVGSERICRGASPDQNIMPVKLKKGSNALLLKIEENVGGYSFMARFTDMKDEPLTTVKVRLPASARQDKTLFVADKSIYKSEIEAKTITEIKYINPEIPKVNLPAYGGTSYEAMRPDTLDIQERAALAINGLTGPTDPRADYELYWMADFFRDPPVMWHDWNDWCQVKFVEALPLMRIITGSDLNNHVDPVWMKAILKSIGPDGLYYTPLEGRPWSRENAYWSSAIFRADGTTTNIHDESVTQLTHPFSCGRIIGTMTIYYSLDNNPMWKELIERMIDRLGELAIHKDNYAYFPNGYFEPNAKVSPDAQLPTGLVGAEGYARLMHGLTQYYRVSGYEPAKVLAGKIIRCLRDHGEFYDTEGRFIKGRDSNPGAHFHAHTINLLGMLDYAVATGDTEHKDFIIKSFEWAKTQGCSRVGFFPEYIKPDYPTAETCEIADMIALAIKLSAAGWGDYWDDADRWIRNQFFENQLTSCDWLNPLAQSQPYQSSPPSITAYRVAERNMGAFAGWASGNDWALSHGIMHCCTGNGVRAIYYIWQDMVQYDQGQLKINLLLNRASPWADVDSYIPYEGRVTVKMKQSCKSLAVRIPQWIASGSKDVSCTVNNKSRGFTLESRYLALGSVKKGDEIDISFPIAERTVEQRIGNVDYTLIIKGNTVVNIDPQGKSCPLYQREHYRSNTARLKKTKRFLCDKIIDW